MGQEVAVEVVTVEVPVTVVTVFLIVVWALVTVFMVPIALTFVLSWVLERGCCECGEIGGKGLTSMCSCRFPMWRLWWWYTL